VTEDPLVGEWSKVDRDPCSSSYPDELELHAGGRYTGRMRPGAREHPRWDVGTYERVEGGLLAISTFTDEVVRYAFTLADERLTFTDEQGCTFGYRRRLRD
jgi:hypothetical protein